MQSHLSWLKIKRDIKINKQGHIVQILSRQEYIKLEIKFLEMKSSKCEMTKLGRMNGRQQRKLMYLKTQQ